MGKILLILISIVAGIFLSVLSNWFYDLLKPSRFPKKPKLKWLFAVSLFFMPLLFLVGLPDIISENSQVTENPNVTSANQVQICKDKHGMTQAHETIQETNDTMFFSFCDWPPNSYSEPDGYTKIRVVNRLTTEFNLDETSMAAMIAPKTDTITSNCQTVRLSYKFEKQDVYEFYNPVEVNTGQVVHIRNLVFGDNITTDSRGISLSDSALLGFYPSRNDLVVISLSGESLENVECVK